MTGRNKKFFSGLSIKRSFIRLDLGYYWFWVILRIFLTLIPQTGYIHPDEYFQTVEIFAGNVFDTDVSLPWEFNTTKPIRSVVVTYITMQIPLSLLKTISEFLLLYFDVNILSSYLLLILPRVVLCLLSFVSDFCLYRICYLYGQNYKERLIVFASSYVCLIFMTRTFNNTIEVLCFNVLLLLVASCMAESEKINYQNDYLRTKYDSAQTIPDRVRIHKLIKLLPQHSLTHCLGIATITVAGTFNRPTFICYAIPPIFYWVQRGMGSKNVSFLKEFHSRVLLLAIYSLPATFLFIFIDSIYYGYITWGEMVNKRINMNNFVVAPLNFLKYNLDSSNLSKHGLHPRFLHILVNIPLLYNVLGVSALIITFKMVYRGTFSNWTLLPKTQSITGMMTLSFIFPLVLLSAIPHQEPRFIVPVLLPLVFLYSHLIKDFQEHCTSVIPFRKRCPPKPAQVHRFLDMPMKCINFVQNITESFDNRYNVNGRFLAMIKHVQNENKINRRPKGDVKNEGYESKMDDFDVPRDSMNGVKNEKPTDIEEDKKPKRKWGLLLVLWFIFNAICVFFFGFFHQGGVYPLASYMSQDLMFKPRLTSIHLVTSHLYSFPLHLLMLKSSKRHHYSHETGKRYKLARDFFIYELGSENMERIYVKLNTILKVSEQRKKEKIINYKLYYAIPASLLNEFEQTVGNFSDFSYNVVKTFYPHLSTEALPKLSFDLSLKSSGEANKEFCFKDDFTCLNNHSKNHSNFFTSFFENRAIRSCIEFVKQFGLVLIRIKMKA